MHRNWKGSIAMACWNTFGLVTGAFLLGFGLSQIPKTLWRNADWTNRRKILSHKIAVKLDKAHQVLSNAVVVSITGSNHLKLDVKGYGRKSSKKQKIRATSHCHCVPVQKANKRKLDTKVISKKKKIRKEKSESTDVEADPVNKGTKNLLKVNSKRKKKILKKKSENKQIDLEPSKVYSHKRIYTTEPQCAILKLNVWTQGTGDIAFLLGDLILPFLGLISRAH